MSNRILKLFKSVESGEINAEEAYVDMVLIFNAANREFNGVMEQPPKPELKVKTGSRIKRMTTPKFNGASKKQFTSVGSEYVVNNIQPDYRGMKVAISFKTDDGNSRWYSYDSVLRDYEILS